MLKASFGITTVHFIRDQLTLLSQQKQIFEIIKFHSQHGSFSVIIGNPGVGKTVLRKHIEGLGKERDTVVVPCTRTLHTYRNILKQLAESFKIDAAANVLEKELIQTAYQHVRDRKTLYILIDEAHLLVMTVLRKLN